MAKFKVGDKVKVKGSTKIGTISRINTNFGFDFYWIDGLSDGKNPPVYGENLLSLANSSTNTVVANALAATARNADGNKAREFYASAARNLAAARQELLKAKGNLNRAISEDDSQVSASVGTQHAKMMQEAYEILSKVSHGLKAG